MKHIEASNQMTEIDMVIKQFQLRGPFQTKISFHSIATTKI